MIKQSINTKPVKVPFHASILGSLAAGVGSFNLSPSLITHTGIASIADAFELYRVSKLSYRLLRAPGITAPQAAAYYPDITDTPPNTLDQNGENVNSTLLSQAATVPTDWVHLSPVAESALKWYKTIQGTMDSWDEIQGIIYVTGSVTESYLLEVKGVYEFKGQADPGNTPELREKRRQARLDYQRKKLLTILASKPDSSVLSSKQIGK